LAERGDRFNLGASSAINIKQRLGLVDALKSEVEARARRWICALG